MGPQTIKYSGEEGLPWSGVEPRCVYRVAVVLYFAIPPHGAIKLRCQRR